MARVSHTVEVSPAPPPPPNEFSFGLIEKLKQRGKARVMVDLPGPGFIELDGDHVRHRRKHAEGEGSVRLNVTAG